jgi:translation initiation factor IF-2
MGKIRVYDLAKKLGIENKDLVDQLNQSGIEVKNHMAVLDEQDAEKFESSRQGAKPAEETADENVQEKRISSGLIRRRRSKAPAPEVVEPVATEPVAEEPVVEEPAAEVVPAEEPAAPVAAKVVSEEAAPVESVEPTTEEPVAKQEVAAEEKTEVKAEEAAPAEPAEPEEPEAPAAPVKKKRPAKDTVVRAKILGRVELPKKVEPPRRKQPAAAGQKRGERVVRADAPGGRPQRPQRPTRPGAPGGAPGGAPMPPPMDPSEIAKEGRNKKAKKKKSVEFGQDRNGAKSGGRRKGKREVYVPDGADRYRKGRKSSRPAKKTEITVSKAIKRKIRISDVITVGELAKRMGVKANDLIKELMSQGQMVTINHPLDFDTAAILAAEFSYEVENVAFDEDSVLTHSSLAETEEKEEDLRPRPPVVTIMGHVDHGKTSLLDAIREANVTDGEAGGITQHIGAYDVELNGRKITFLDTPGHEAFTAMRARGAEVTDIVILVVAADDGVMPQTREAVNHSKAGNVPIIVAVNKIDRPEANPDRVKQELAELDLLPEDWGGETIYANVSAKERTNIDQLLEMILLQAEVMDLQANPDQPARGAVVEARLDKGRGPIATVLVQKGTLRIGDPIVAGLHYGRVRSMTDDRGHAVEEAGPSFPVEVTGLIGVPDAGESFHGVEDEKTARDVSQHRQHKLRELELAKTSKISLDQLYARIKEGEYGNCDDCGEEIAIKRLEARPVAKYCIDCKTRQEQEEKAQGR